MWYAEVRTFCDEHASYVWTSNLHTIIKGTQFSGTYRHYEYMQPVVPEPSGSYQASMGVVSKVLLKAVGSAKRNSKTFMLRNVNTYCQCEFTRQLMIRTQLRNDIVPGDFDVGYLQGSTVINIRSCQDLVEVWNDIRRGMKVAPWYDGLKEITPMTRKGISNLPIQKMTLTKVQTIEKNHQKQGRKRLRKQLIN